MSKNTYGSNGETAGSTLRAEAAEFAERERLMEEFSITFNGRYYQYQCYRYDRLEDAVNYAQLRRNKPAGVEESQGAAPAEQIAAPTDAQLKLMASLGITFQQGMYYLGHYRYDHLSDAVKYAQQQASADAQGLL